jgi:hypothetical protein
MTPAEVAKVLTKASAYDLRTVGQADVIAWHEALSDIELADALEAVARHFRLSTDRLMPAHVRQLVRDIRDERLRANHHEIRQLPSRFEPDSDRSLRVSAGVAMCGEILRPLFAELARRRAEADIDPVNEARARAIVRARAERKGRRT